MSEMIVCAGNQVEVSGVPTEIKILPLGAVESQKGNFQVDDESFSLIEKQFKSRRLDLPIDYEHQTLGDVQAPAAGWIKELYKRADAITARVEWTKRGAEYLKNKEYRYLSPVVLVRKRDKKAVLIHSAALTNTPAIDGMFPVVNAVQIEDLEMSDKSDKMKGESIMDLKELAKLLGLSEDAAEEEVKKAMAAAMKAKEEREREEREEQQKKEEQEEKTSAGSIDHKTEIVANSTILSMLGLSETAKTEDVAASIMSLKGVGGSMQAEFLELKEKWENQEADQLVETALRAGKISAAQRTWAKEYALKDRKGFQSFMDKAPSVVPVGSLELKDAPQDTTEVDAVILKSMGISKEDIDKYGRMEL